LAHSLPDAGLSAAGSQVGSTLQQVVQHSEQGIEDNRRSILYDDRLVGTFITRDESTSEDETEQIHADHDDELDRKQAEAARASVSALQKLFKEPARHGSLDENGEPKSQLERMDEIFGLMNQYRYYKDTKEDVYRDAVREFASFQKSLLGHVAPVFDRLESLQIRREAFDQLSRCADDIADIGKDIDALRKQKDDHGVEKSRLMAEPSLQQLQPIDGPKLREALSKCFGSGVEPKRELSKDASDQDKKLAKLALLEVQVNAIDHQISMLEVKLDQLKLDREAFARECEANDPECRDLWHDYRASLNTYGALGQQTAEALSKWQQAFHKVVGTEVDMLKEIERTVAPFLFTDPVGFDPITKSQLRLLFEFKQLHELTGDGRKRGKMENDLIADLGLKRSKSDSKERSREATQAKQSIGKANDEVHELLDQHFDCWKRALKRLATDGVLDASSDDLRQLASALKTVFVQIETKHDGVSAKEDVAIQALVKRKLNNDLQKLTKKSDASLELSVPDLKQGPGHRQFLRVSNPNDEHSGLVQTAEITKGKQLRWTDQVGTDGVDDHHSDNLENRTNDAEGGSPLDNAYDLSLGLASAYAALLESDSQEARQDIHDILRDNHRIKPSDLIFAVSSQPPDRRKLTIEPTIWLIERLNELKRERDRLLRNNPESVRAARENEFTKQASETLSMFSKLEIADRVAQLNLGFPKSIMDRLTPSDAAAIDQTQKALGLSGLQVRALYLYTLSLVAGEEESRSLGLNLDELRKELRSSLGFPEVIRFEKTSFALKKAKQAEFDPPRTLTTKQAEFDPARTLARAMDELIRANGVPLVFDDLLPIGFKEALQKEMLVIADVSKEVVKKEGSTPVTQEVQAPGTGSAKTSHGESKRSGLAELKTPPREVVQKQANTVEYTQLVVIRKNMMEGVLNIAKHVLAGGDSDKLQKLFDQTIVISNIPEKVIDFIANAAEKAAQEQKINGMSGPKSAQMGLLIGHVSKIKESAVMATLLYDLDQELLPIFLGRLHPKLAVDISDPSRLASVALAEGAVEGLQRFRTTLNEMLEDGYQLNDSESRLPSVVQERLKQEFDKVVRNFISVAAQISSELDFAKRIQSGAALDTLPPSPTRSEIEVRLKALEEVMASSQIREFLQSTGYSERYTHLSNFLEQCSLAVQKMALGLDRSDLMMNSRYKSDFAAERDALRRLSSRIEEMRKFVTDLGLAAADQDENVV
jgi:hypothetical protein